MEYFLQGFTLGLAYVAPIGLQNMFVINTALTQSFKKAISTAFIVIFFDITLAFACFFGIGSIMETSKFLQLAILLIGSLIVIYIGIGLIKAKGDITNKTEVNIPLTKVITSACVVTWFNPQAIIDGSMMLGAFRASLPSAQTTNFILGVTGASMTWFISITILISLFHNLFNEKILRGINLICGTVICFYGLKLLYTFYILL